MPLTTHCHFSLTIGPTLGDVISLNIIAGTVVGRWENIARRTGQESSIASYREKYPDNEKECADKVFAEWFDGEGCEEYPITWQALYNLLCDVGERETANRLADAKAGIVIERRP
jgi:hypothetical protein